MSKVAQYLNEHLLGEVTTNDHVRQLFSTDASVLTILPDMVVFPRSTSDLRKVARFSWQLAEKGHKLPITVRGGGTDQTGAAIGSGVIVNTSAHLDTIFELDAKQKLVRVQPGVTFKALNEALRMHGLYIPSFPESYGYSTIGGAIANNASGLQSGKYGATGEWVHQLEIVLANGEVLQTGRVNKREVSKKRGLQTFEGEIYRNIENLINDNDELLDTLDIDVRDNAGYAVVDVQRRDGSIDLTSLFIGSQGTLGIISEIIMRVEHIVSNPLVGAVAFPDHESARDGLDTLRSYDPSVMELIDGRLLVEASKRGKVYQFYKEAQDDQGEVAAIVYIEFDNPNDRAKKKIAKKIAKHFDELPAYVVLESEADKVIDLQTLRRVPTVMRSSEDTHMSAAAVLNGAYIPAERFEDFANAVSTIADKHHIDLPLSGHASQHVYYSYPLFHFQKVSDRQKILKLITEWSAAVSAHGGHLIGEAGEGRLKSLFAYKVIDDEIKEMYKAIKELFDPMDILNSGVKQSGDIKSLAAELRTDYSGIEYLEHGIGE